VASAKSVILSGGAQAKNIFWQVAGGVGVDIGTTAHLEGILLAQAGINMQTGASINGRLLAQTAVTLQSNVVTAPTEPVVETILLRSAAEVAGQKHYGTHGRPRTILPDLVGYGGLHPWNNRP
jgi:hypothetical protein